MLIAGVAKPAIFLEGGIHAREWISPATVTFIIRELVTNPAHAELLHMYDWIIVPITNPDGYEYSHTKVSHHSSNTLPSLHSPQSIKEVNDGQIFYLPLNKIDDQL